MKKLSRDEMKKVMGGDPPAASCGCTTNLDCGNQDHYCSTSQVITCDDQTTGRACVYGG
jgi:hypothetical protein